MTLWYNLPPYKTPNCVKFLQLAYKAKNAKIRNFYLRKAANEFLDCNKSGGEVSKGLTRKVNTLNKWFIRDIK
jgi:alkyl sulfatase BDS1-like metallo-beta-lactamase superfamily hydrolase